MSGLGGRWYTKTGVPGLGEEFGGFLFNLFLGKNLSALTIANIIDIRSSDRS